MSALERQTLLALHQALSEEQFETLKFLLEEQVPAAQLRPATRPDLCRILLQRFPGRALHVAADLLRHIPRHDLILLHQLPGAEAGTPGQGERAPEAGTPRDRTPQPVPPAPAASAPAPQPPRRLTEKDLIQIAQRLGKEWQEVGICCLGVGRSRLEQIREDNPHSVVMQSFEMLREWQRREREAATAPRLCACLAPAHPSPELLDLLWSLQGN
ncbi:ankyrin-3-like [Colius striatus]|uniref:ankyrin-3-like n=1 Tax=Colius striatus TaxID=57412 RepID=UPI002B1DB5D4|nr:ankyrin-3-like [Colius striatus]